MSPPIDCGTSYSCVSQALSRAQPATVTAGGVVLRLDSVSRSTAGVTATVAGSGSEPAPTGSCSFQIGALQTVLADAQSMGALSPTSFLAADSCQGSLFASLAPMRATLDAARSRAPAAAGAADCGVSLPCLVRGLQQHAPAQALEVTMLPLFGLNVTAVSYLRTSEFDANDVTVYMRTLQTDVTFDPKMVQRMQAKGMSSNDIAAAQAKAQASARATDGRDGTCRYKIAVLDAVLRRWYNGSFSTDDYAKADKCQGSLFETSQSGQATF
ncbi:MAG TPA: hypothetical protein VNG31_07775 [Candidatus Baltobacteraceae bacterium]|nr:hypothetical protein [Candidatus Baltobacteraceae bacterium]